MDSKPKLRHELLALELHKVLFKLRQRHHTNIVWMPAHCDIKNHDLADTLAVEAAKEALTHGTGPIPGYGRHMASI